MLTVATRVNSGGSQSNISLGQYLRPGYRQITLEAALALPANQQFGLW